MEEVEKRVLSRLRTQLIKEMVVTESFLSAFCRSDLLDDHLATAIRSETNFEKRAAKLLETLPSQSSRAFTTLMEILEITNPWLSEKMRAALHDEKTKDAKINIHPSVAKNASIEGFGHCRLHIDPDIKERSGKFVHTNLNHLTEVEQRGVEKWVADELQKERRRQHFRAPHETRRQRTEFHSSKETQTDTCVMDLRDLFNELAIYLHGVDYDEHEDKLGFGLIQEEVKELLGRTKKLDNLFLNCWNKFDDTDKYSMSLPDLIDRTVHHERRLMAKEELNKQMIHKLKEERDGLKRRVRHLEEDVDKLLQRQASIIPPQEIQLRHRQNVHMRYTFPHPVDSSSALVNNDGVKPYSQHEDHQNGSQDSKSQHCNGDGDSMSSGGSHKDRNVAFRQGGEYTPPKEPEKVPNTARNGGSSNLATTNGPANGSLNGHRVNGPGGHIHRAEPVHFEEKRMSISSSHSEDLGNIHNVGRRSAGSGNEGDLKGVETRDEHQRTAGSNGYIRQGNGSPVTKIRRHASEESLRIAISRDASNSVSTSRLSSDQQPFKLSVEDLPTTVAQQSRETAPKQQQQQQRVTRADLQSRMQKMLASSHRQVVDTQKQRQRSGGPGSNMETTKTPQDEMITSRSKGPVRPMVNRDASPSAKGKAGLQSAYQVTNNNSKARDTNKPSTQSKSQGNVNDYIQHRQQQHGQYQNQFPTQERQALFHLASRYNGSATEDYANKYQQAERYVHNGNPYRSSSTERLSRVPTTTIIPTGSNPGHRQATNSYLDPQLRDYTSDSELILKPSSLRGKTTRSDKSRSRVRFASPIARTSNPPKKVSGRTQRFSHYQMETASTVRKKIQK